MAYPAEDTSGSARLDRTFSALAHPARRAMLSRLARGPASASELGAPLAMSQPAVSKHLKVLEVAGLIRRGRDAQWRPSELRAEALLEADRWLAAFRRTWEDRLDRLDAYLAETGGGGPTPPALRTITGTRSTPQHPAAPAGPPGTTRTKEHPT